MAACIGCRKCEKACPSFAHGGCNPYEVMQGEDGDIVDCIGCGKCSEVCPVTDPKQVMMHQKQKAKRAMVPDNFVKYGVVTRPDDGSWREGLPASPVGDDAYYMPGCIVEGFVPFLKYAAEVSTAAVGVGSDEMPRKSCCMYPVSLRSFSDSDRDAYKFRMRDSTGGRETFTLCGGCFEELAKSDVDFPYILDVFMRNIDKIRAFPGVKMKVAVETGCTMEYRRSEVEELIRACGSEPMTNESGCCGKSIERISDEMMAERQAECAGADVIVVCCPNCQKFYDKWEGGIPVLHIVELVALAAGNSVTQKFHDIKLPERFLRSGRRVNP